MWVRKNSIAKSRWSGIWFLSKSKKKDYRHSKHENERGKFHFMSVFIFLNVFDGYHLYLYEKIKEKFVYTSRFWNSYFLHRMNGLFSFYEKFLRLYSGIFLFALFEFSGTGRTVDIQKDYPYAYYCSDLLSSVHSNSTWAYPYRVWVMGLRKC